ncbi:TMEM175 family protein [Sphingomonas sp. ASV193]|uniref:TMEM175 family protein n=1 Tax=Sphingomonas sp. ASV193 TaxID=3144405 RepID=UPI0032E90D42
MGAERLAAYSDGVVAIIVTIMVLDLHPPARADVASLARLWPVFSAYVLSFLIVSIYWMNHHHLLHANRRIGRDVMWFNLLWLFCLSLFPFTTAFVSSSRGSPLAVSLYALLGSLTGFAFLLLGVSLSRRNADVEVVGRIARQRQRKNLFALALNVAAVFLAFVWVPLALACLALPAIAYFLPDRRVETS